MFSDPQIIPIAGQSVSLARLSADRISSEYRHTSATGEHYHLEIGQRPESKRGRRQATVVLRFEDVVTSELEEGTNVPISVSCRATLDYPQTGVVTATMEVVAAALAAWLATPANVAKLCNGEL